MTLIASDALVSLVVLVALIALIYGPWQWVCTDYARQVVFEKRDEIFDMAANGELNFKSAEYRAIRSSLEACIRFAHDLTLPNFFFLAVVRRTAIPTEKSSLHAAVDNLPIEVRNKVRKKVMEAMRALILMMVFKSPVTIIAFIPLSLAIVLVEGCRKLAYRWAVSCAEMIQVEAEQSPSAIKVLASY